MSIMIAILLGIVFGAMLGALWRAEEMETLAKANARLLEERHQAQDMFRTKQRQNWVN